jgi:hypothetical protein
MPTTMDHDESELLDAFERGQLKSIASKSELARLKAAARATGLKGVTAEAEHPEDPHPGPLPQAGEGGRQ